MRQRMQARAIPVRIYRADNRIMLAAPMPGLEPPDISVRIAVDRVIVRGRERGPRQHGLDLVAAEWTIGSYYREVVLPEPVNGALTNATYGNGVLMLSMPRLITDSPENVSAEFRLEPVESVRGERIGHTGRAIHPTTTEEHRRMRAEG